MSESADGVSFSVTRQNAGSVLNTAASFAFVVLGGVKAPAGADSAVSTCPFVTFSCASDSHAIGAGAAAFERAQRYRNEQSDPDSDSHAGECRP